MRTAISRTRAASLSAAVGMIMSISAASAGEVIGWMDVDPVEQQIGVTAHAYAPGGSKVEFELQVERMGSSGKTSTKQRGKADLEPGKTAKLSTTSVNIAPGDQMAILLTIFSGGQVVSTNALHIGPH